MKTIYCRVFVLQDEAAALLAAATTPLHHHVAERGSERAEGAGADGDAASDAGSESGGGELSRAPDDLVDPVADRRTLAERNERLHNQLKVHLSRQDLHPPGGLRCSKKAVIYHTRSMRFRFQFSPS